MAADLLEFLGAWRASASADTVAAALDGGLRAHLPAHAFAAGYVAALQRLDVGVEGRFVPRALCVTEPAGNHPRAISTVLDSDRVTGTKAFVTLADKAERLLVLASAGEEDGRKLLRLVEVDPQAEGVRIEPLPELPFVPEIGHCSVHFDGVTVLRLLPGDGWTDYVRPFRTIEDLHVLAAYTGLALSMCDRFSGDRSPLEPLRDSIRALGGTDLDSPGAHLALAGLFAWGKAVFAGLEFPHAESGDLVAWTRDAALLKVAGRAREKRRLRAWSAV